MRSVGMRKRNWFKTVGALTFGVQMLAGAGLANAAPAHACFPQTAFVSGGNPDFTSLSPDNVLKWTGASGYGWNSGATDEMSYQAAMGINTNYPVTGFSTIQRESLLLQFQRNMAAPQVTAAQGFRLGFSYPYTEGGKTTTISEVAIVNFAADNHPGFSATPPTCSCTVTTNCANDPVAQPDPTQWVSITPSVASIAQVKTTAGVDAPPTNWPGTNDFTWLANQTRLWIFVDNSDPNNKTYTWRLQASLPIQIADTTTNQGPDPNGQWLVPAIFLDHADFSALAAGKNIPSFWLDMITDAAFPTSGTTPLLNQHFPDWADDSMVGRGNDGFDIPSTTQWGLGEIGSPRAAALLAPTDISCSGGGLAILGTVGDNVVYHSNIWNDDAGLNTAGLFSDGGQLNLLTTTGTLGKNRMRVEITNGTANDVAPSSITTQFSIAPYGAQSPSTIWAPLNLGGNDFTCKEGTSQTANAASCTPLPMTGVNYGPIASTPAPGNILDGSNMTPSGSTFDLYQGTEWIPSADYMCATQYNDNPGSISWDYGQSSVSNSICKTNAYHPTDPSGNGAGGGLYAHQCIQAQLGTNGVGVQFATKSAFRNMHQAPASLHRETATIDTLGLKKISGQSYHNIYLYLETKNMPYRVDAGYSPTTYNAAMTLYNRDSHSDKRQPGFNPNVPAPSENFFAKTMPTLIVHAYADTGHTYKNNGVTYPVLTQLTSFGQFVSHDASVEGPAYGWDASLEAVTGTAFEKVGPNTYRLQIPNDAAGKVVTHVEALPTVRPTCSGTVNMNIVQLLQSIAPMLTTSPADAGEINTFIDSLQIQCVDLAYELNKIGALNWGTWQSWVKLLITEIEAASGCTCK